MAHTGSTAAPRVQPLFEAHIILDGSDSAHPSRNFDRLVDICLRAYEAAQLHDALEGFDIDFGRLQSRIIEYRRLGFGRDHGVVDVFPGTFLLGRGCAANGGRQCYGGNNSGNAFEMFHSLILQIDSNLPANYRRRTESRPADNLV